MVLFVRFEFRLSGFAEAAFRLMWLYQSSADKISTIAFHLRFVGPRIDCFWFLLQLLVVFEHL